MFTLAKKPQTLDAVFMSSWQLFKENFSKLWFFGLLYGVLFAPCPILQQHMKEQPMLFFAIIFLCIGALFISINTLSYLGKKTGLMDTNELSYLKIALLRLPKFIPLFLTFFIVAFLFFLFIYLFESFLITPVAIVFSIIALFLLSYFFMCIPFISAILVFEKKGPLESIEYGIKLVSKKWWQTFVLCASVFAVFQILLNFVTGAAAGFVIEFIKLTSHLNFSTATVSLFVSISIASIFYLPLSSAVTIVQLNNLKLIQSKNINKEGNYDLIN